MNNQIVRVSHKIPGAVYIGRGSKWGNPFPITPTMSREIVIEYYRDHLWTQIKRGDITIADLLELDGKPLACFCAPLPCHGNVIAAAVEWAKSQGEAQ